MTLVEIAETLERMVHAKLEEMGHSACDRSVGWSEGYRPLEEDLSPQDYAGYGFTIGYRAALRDLAREFTLNN